MSVPRFLLVAGVVLLGACGSESPTGEEDALETVGTAAPDDGTDTPTTASADASPSTTAAGAAPTDPEPSSTTTTSAPPAPATDPTTTTGGTSTTTTTTTTSSTTSTTTTTSSTTSTTTSTTSTTTAAPAPATPSVDLRTATITGIDGRGDPVGELTARLGQPSEDTGWLPMPPTLACTGNLDVRSVHWGDLRVVVERADPDASDSSLTGWSLGLASIPYAPSRRVEFDLAPPSGVTTADGVEVGDPIDAVTAVEVTQTDDTSWLAPVAGGILFETDRDDRIVGIAAGRGDCIGLDITDLPCTRPVPVFELPDGSPAGDVSIDGGRALWGVENGNGGDDSGNVVSEPLGGLPFDDPLVENARSGPSQAVSGETIVSAIPTGDPGVGGWSFYVFDEGTPCARVLSTSFPFELDEARAYARVLADDLNPQL